MNCGLSNLATLKSFVIPVALQDRPDFDADVRQIGVGVLGMLEAHCNRRFARTVGDTITVTADRSFFYLPRIPIEGAVEIALRVAGDADFATQDDLQSQLDPTTGGIEFLTVAATYRDRLRFTWTGGYWFQSAEAGE